MDWQRRDRVCKTKYYTNSSWHWGPYCSLWTGLSHTIYYMDRREVPWTICYVIHNRDQLQSERNLMHYLDIFNANTNTITKIIVKMYHHWSLISSRHPLRTKQRTNIHHGDELGNNKLKSKFNGFIFSSM